MKKLFFLIFLLMATNAWAADSKVSALTELAVTPAASDELYINDGGTSKKIQYSKLMDGEALKDDSIDDDSIDFGEVTGVDITLTDAGAVTSSAAVTATTSFIIGSADMNEADLEKLDGITDGTAAASKCVVLDASKDVATINSLTATTLVGALTGNADTSTLAATVTIADNESTSETNAVVFLPGGDLDGGNLALESDGTFNYNPSSGTVTSTTFAGALTGAVTGNVTGNCSGTAATVTTAAQPNITSVGTLTTLTVDDITVNGNTISSAGASTLAITPTTGQTITLDGTVTLDAGVIAGATSITSTGFTGELTGNSSTATALAANPAAATSGSCITNIDASGDVEAEVDVWTEAENTAAGYGVGTFLADGSVDMTGDIDLDGNSIYDVGGVTVDTLFVKEQADASADAAGYGQMWVNTATPNELWFTDDSGVDFQLGQGSLPTTPSGTDCFVARNASGTAGCYTSFDISDNTYFYDAGAATAQFQFDASNITAGQTRAITVPDSNQTVGVATSAGANAIDSASYVDGSIDEEHLNAANSPTDEYVLTYESDTTNFQWVSLAGGGDITGVGTCTTGDCTTDFIDTTDITADSITSKHLSDDSVTADTIATLNSGRSLTWDTTDDEIDADSELYTDVKCIYIEDPAATDDLKSIWTANGFAATITKIWCESDQADGVQLDLQIDDGSPADVAGTDLDCDSTPDEDETGLTGSMADGDRLDLIIASVGGSENWLTVCWTFTKDD